MNQTTIDVHLSSGLKTIAQTSMEVADTLIMLVTSRFSKMEYIGQKK